MPTSFLNNSQNHFRVVSTRDAPIPNTCDCSRITDYPEVIHMVAVGTIITDRPPHRTVRAALPHTAPTLEDWRAVLLLAHRSSPGTLSLRAVSGECWV